MRAAARSTTFSDTAGTIPNVLSGKRVRLRPVRPGDEQALTRIFTDPDVARWWGDPSRSVQDALNPDDSESGFMIEAGDETIGFIQCSEENDPMYEHAGIDLALHSDWQGQGLGPDANPPPGKHLRIERGPHRPTLDPAPPNGHAHRAIQRAGIKP